MRLSPSPLVILALTFAMGPPPAQATAAPAPAPYDVVVLSNIHGNADGFWTDMGSSVVDHVAEYADVPVYHVTGWYDSWGTSVANLNYVELSRAKRSPQR